MLVDTGILLRAFDANFTDYRIIRRALRAAFDGNTRLYVAIQNIAEFWNVATQPLDKNGHGLSATAVTRRMAIIERLCGVVSEDSSSYREWKRIVEQVGISGVAVHDARLVSVMRQLKLNYILTLNERDFRRYSDEGIEPLNPQQFLTLNEFPPSLPA